MSKTSNSTVESNEKLSSSDIIAYGLGAGPSTLTTQFKSQFFMPFLTDFANLDIAQVGVWSTVATVFDAINDPLIGGISDRTNTKRWGKYRPHMMMGSILLALVVIMMFLVPDFSSTGKLVYYVSLMCLFTVFNTQFTVPWQALNSIMSADPHQRNLLLTSRQFLGFIATSFVSIVFVPVLKLFPDEQTGYLVTAFVVAGLCIITGQACAYGCRKRDYYHSIPNPPKTNIKGQFRLVFQNRAVLCVAVMLGAVTLINAITGALTVYYANVVVGKKSLILTMAVVQLIVSFIVFPFVPKLLKKLGKPKALVLGSLIMLSNSIMLAVLRERASVAVILVFHAFTVMGFLFANVATLGMIPDCADYTEYKFGNASAGFINSAITFARKCFRSLATLIVGFFLGLAGYNAAPNTPQVVDMIINIKIFVPVILIALCLVTLKLYPITTAFGSEMRKQLKETRAKNA